MNIFVRLVTSIMWVQFVVLIGFLVFLCFQTRSKGLIWVTAALTLMKVKVLNRIVGIVLNIFNPAGTGQWNPSSDVRGVAGRLEIHIIVGGIEGVLGYGLCLLGAFLIYKEWRQ